MEKTNLKIKKRNHCLKKKIIFFVNVKIDLRLWYSFYQMVGESKKKGVKECVNSP
jgi:hypothetical protein